MILQHISYTTWRVFLSPTLHFFKEPFKIPARKLRLYLFENSLPLWHRFSGQYLNFWNLDCAIKWAIKKDYIKLFCKYLVSSNKVLSTLVLSYNFDDKIHKKYKFQTQILVGIGASSKKSTTITTNFLGWKFFRNKKFILDKIT